ncbi:hypothetical protein [Paenibacillus sedimenti]|uniref:Uncharacterized protein n=1 Tax=Paenibacillus sedimenti TaxID=2770274 RepID=A0A926QNI5_9BACL|nr:hypothetical protein [Paenibacillus sedimenti]MBD0384822.1 hypothetical protein [Paenibacillus sedimenti]
MNRKSVVAGILLSLAVPMIVYFAIVSIPNDVLKPPEDFQYHDSYFFVIHIDPYVYPVLSVITFTVYVVLFSVVRYVKRKYV